MPLVHKNISDYHGNDIFITRAWWSKSNPQLSFKYLANAWLILEVISKVAIGSNLDF